LVRNSSSPHYGNGGDLDVDTTIYFSALLDDPHYDAGSSSKYPVMTKSAIVGLLALPALQFQAMSSSTIPLLDEVRSFNTTSYPLEQQLQNQYAEEEIEISKLYMNAVALHVDALIHVWNSHHSGKGFNSNFSSKTLIVEIIQVCFNLMKC